ncbi:MAG TPA: hypothetical protein VFC70_00055 [Oscillospiraceae bacterium]|nr:hypothetical protein [Oscillospiraceae bacterium]
MRKNKATDLKDFLLIYYNKKSDAEISQLLFIPIEQVRREKEKISAGDIKNLRIINYK